MLNKGGSYGIVWIDFFFHSQCEEVFSKVLLSSHLKIVVDTRATEVISMVCS